MKAIKGSYSIERLGGPLDGTRAEGTGAAPSVDFGSKFRTGYYALDRDAQPEALYRWRPAT